MAHYLLQCTDVEDGLALRQQHRSEHLAHVRSGEIVRAAGAVLDESEAVIGSWLVIETADRAEAEAWSMADPFRQYGVYADVLITPVRMTYTNINRAES